MAMPLVSNWREVFLSQPVWLERCSRLVAVLLFPILWWERRAMRRAAPRRLAASADLKGAHGDVPRLSLLLIGESQAAAPGLASHADGLAGALATELGRAKKIPVGWRVSANAQAGVQEILEQTLAWQGHAEFPIVFCVLGQSDVLQWTHVREFRRALCTLVDVVKARTGCVNLVLASIPPVHDYPAVGPCSRMLLRWRVNAFDSVLQELAASQDFAVADIQSDDAGDFADDGFHLSAKGYQHWATRLVHSGLFIAR